MAKKIKKTYDPGIILNRKINYSIIRYYWDIINHSVSGLYDTIGFGKTKYDSIVYDGNNINLDKEANDLQIITGIGRQFFTGNKRFDIDKNEIDWEQHFELCLIRKGLKTGDIQEIEDYKDEYNDYLVIEKGELNIDESIIKVQQKINETVNSIKEKLRDTKYTYDSNKDMFMLKYFMQNGQPYTTESRLQNLIRILGRVNSSQLSNISNETLEVYIEMLTYQLKISEAVLAIRNYDENEIENKIKRFIN
jgi:hypothetical protein